MKRYNILVTLLLIALAASAQAPLLSPKEDSKKPLWGYVNSKTGKWVVKPMYDVAEPLKQGVDGKYRALVTKGSRQGFIGSDGKVLGAGVVFESIEPLLEGNNLIVTVKGKKGIVTPDGVYVLKPELTELNPLGKEGYIAAQKDKKGFLNAKGDVLIPFQYTGIDPTEPGFFIVDKGGKAGLYSRNGKLILEPNDFNHLVRFEGLWKVKKGDKTGLYDSETYRLLVKPEYGEVLSPVKFDGGEIYPVMKTNGKWGAVDSSGKEVLKCKNQALSTVPAINAVMVYRNGVGQRLWMPEYNVFLELDSWNESPRGPFRVLGGQIARPTEQCPQRMIAGLSFGEYAGYESTYDTRKKAFNSLGGKTNIMLLVDSKGRQVGGMETSFHEFGNNWLVRPSKNSRWIIYDSKGNKVRETGLGGEHFWVSSTQGWVASDNKILFPDLREYPFIAVGTNLQFMRPEGSQRWIPIVNDRPEKGHEGFDEVYSAGEDRASVNRGGKWGLFADGKLKIDCRYPTPLRKASLDGYLETGGVGTLGLLTTDGKEVLSAQYDSISASRRKGCITVYRNGIVGLYSPKSDHWILPLERKYTNYSFVDDNYSESPIWIYKGEMGGVANENGEEIVPVVFDKITRLNSLGVFECKKSDGNGKRYYTLSGEPYAATATAYLSDESHEGDRNYNGNKGEMQWVDIHASFMSGHRIKLKMQLYNANGTPHVTRGGQHFKKEYYWDVDDDSFFVDDQSFFIPYSFISQPRYTDKDYYVKYTLIDATTGRVLDTATIKFGMRRS